MLEGNVVVTVEGVDRHLGHENFFLVPRGVAHTFGNLSDEAARRLVLHAPAMDEYFAKLHDLWNRDHAPSVEEEQSLMAQFGVESV